MRLADLPDAVCRNANVERGQRDCFVCSFYTVNLRVRLMTPIVALNEVYITQSLALKPDASLELDPSTARLYSVGIVVFKRCATSSAWAHNLSSSWGPTGPGTVAGLYAGAGSGRAPA